MTLSAFADDIWTAQAPIRFAGAWFPHTMTVVRLQNGEVLLHSPCKPSAVLDDQVNALGNVAHVVAPNWFHDLYLAAYRAAYPGAMFWGPPLLRRLRGASLIDRALCSQDPPPWFAELSFVSLSGLLTMDERVFFHKRSRTLIVADFFMNLHSTEQTQFWTRFTRRLAGVESRLAVFPFLHWVGAPGKSRLRRPAAQIIEWNADRLIVGHGNSILRNAQEPIREALQRM